MLKRAGSSHFARHYFGNLGWFLFLQLLRCFSSPRSLCIPMYSVCNDLKGRVSPFGNLRIKACLLAPRSLSQATTSFIACNRQGIHHVHLFTCPYNVSLISAFTDIRRYKDILSFNVCRIQRCISLAFCFYTDRFWWTLFLLLWLIQSQPTSTSMTSVISVLINSLLPLLLNC